MKTRYGRAMVLLVALSAVTVGWNAFAGELPAGYTRVDYIESTGTQYIDTRYIHKANTKVICVANFSAKQIGSFAAIFGSRKVNKDSNSFELFFRNNGANMPMLGRTGAYDKAESEVPTGQVVEYTAEGANASWRGVDDPAISGSITSNGTIDDGIHYMFVCGLNQSDAARGTVVENTSLSCMKLYSFKIYEDGELLHDLVPCVSPSGFAGMYDLVAESFCPNRGEGRFFLPGEPDMFFARGNVEFLSKQWINTGFQPTEKTRIETRVRPNARTENWASLFGVLNNDSSANAVDVRYYSNVNKLNGLFCNATYGEAQIAITPGTDMDISIQSGGLTVNGQTATITTTKVPYQNSLYLGCENNSGTARRWQSARFYTFRIFENGVLQRDFIPTRLASNEITYYDKVNGNHHYTQTGNSFTGYGELSYSPSGTHLTVFDGKLQPTDLTGFTSLEKVGLLALDASAITTLPDFSLSGGVLSFFDGLATTHTAGTMALAGGTRIEVDLTATGADSLTADSIDLSTASAGNPITIAVREIGTVPSTARTILAGGLTESDLAKFKLDSATPLQLAIIDGALTLAPSGVTLSMPVGYRQLEYIRANGGGQYINTGYLHTPFTALSCEIKVPTQDNARVCIFGARDDAANAWRSLEFFAKCGSGADVGFNSANQPFAGVNCELRASNADTFAFDEKVTVSYGNGRISWSGGGKSGQLVSTEASVGVDGECLYLLDSDLKRSPSGWGGDVQLYMFRIYDGAELVRDFVPCINPRGEAGLYDRVGRKFYGSLGRERFQTPVEPQVDTQYVYVRSTGTQWVSTGFKPTTETKAEIWFNPKAVTTAWAGIFSTMSADKANNAFTLRYYDNTANLNGLFCNSNYKEAQIAITPETDVHATLEKNLLTVNDATAAITTINAPYQGDIAVFGDNNDGTVRRFQAMTFYRMTLSDNGALVRELVPWRQADGSVGLYDLVNSTFHANQGTGHLFTGGRAFSRSGSTYVMWEGSFGNEQLSRESEIEKAGPFGVSVAEFTNCTSLAVTEGALLFDDGVVRTTTIAGPLALAGRTTLALDLTAEDNDMLAAQSLALTATAESPVLILVNAIGVAELESAHTLISGGSLTSADLAKFALSASIPAQLAIENGNLLLIAKDTATYVWTGSATDGNWSSPANWEGNTIPEVGAKLQFNNEKNRVSTMDITDLVVNNLRFGAEAGAFAFDGSLLGVQNGIVNESANVQTFNLPMALGVTGKPFTVTTDQSMTMVGGISSTAGEIVKTGAGELLIDDTAIAQAGGLDIRAGTVKLNVTETINSASTPGEIRVAAGARLDTNVDYGNTEDGRRKGEATYGKDIYIAGDGPDGKGAIYNSNPIAHWGPTTANLHLTADASIGGGYFGVRPMTGSTITNCSVQGAYTLTQRNPVQEESTCFQNLFFALHQFDVRNSKLQLQGALTGAITNGIHFYGTSVLSSRSAELPASIPMVIEDGATTFLSHQSSAYRAPLTVAEGATLTMNTTTQQEFWGPVTINGTFNKTCANELAFLGGVFGTGNIVSSSNCFALGADSDFAGTIDITGGWLKFGFGAKGAIPKNNPKFNTIKVDIHFHYGAPTEIGAEYDEIVARTVENQKTVGLFAINEADALTLKNATWNVYNLTMANSYCFGNLVIDEGSTVTVNNELLMGAVEGTKNTRLTIKEGGTLNLLSSKGEYNIGNNGKGTATHRLIVDGGTLNVPNFKLTVGRSGYACYLDLNDGLLAAKAIEVRRAGAYGTNPADRYERFTQTGGLLELGDGGFSAATLQYEDPSIDLKGGTLKPMSALTLPYGTFYTTFGETPSESTYTIDLNGQTVNWNSALQGWNNVKLSGVGTFNTLKEFQGVPQGNWQVESDTVTANLAGAAGFAGGITLGEGASATIDIATDSIVEMGVFTTAEFANFTAVTNYHGPYQNLANTMERLHRYDSAGLLQYCFYCYRGEFYVPEAKTYYFAGTYDDYLTLEVDDAVVLSTVGEIGPSWQQVGTGNRELAVGWHKFRVACYDQTGGQGPGWSDWKGVMALGWTTTEPTAPQSSSSYIKFDPSTLKMRPGEETAVTLDDGNSRNRVRSAGLGGTTTLAAGSTLANIAAGSCPIWGVIEGTGALDGNFAFNEIGKWRVRMNGARPEVLDTRAVANHDFVKRLRQIEVVLAAPASSRSYPLCAAGSLTAEEAAEIVVTAQAEIGVVDVECEGWCAKVDDGKLCLINPKPMGTIMFVR